MVGEGPYEILPYAEIEKLKKQIEDLRKKTASSEEVLDAINRLTKIIESMLHLFESAAAGMKKEGEGPLGKKLDEIIDQNETIAESILSLADMVKELQSKEKEPYIMRQKPQPIIPPEPMPRIGSPDFSMPPSFERTRPMPPPWRGPPPMPPVPPRKEAPIPPPPPVESMPGREGPILMPTGSFKDLELGKPKKGLFGRFRK